MIYYVMKPGKNDMQIAQNITFFKSKDTCISKMKDIQEYLMTHIQEPLMTQQELEFLYDGFKNAHNYFEIGSGTSTIHAIKYGLEVVSVESDIHRYSEIFQIIPKECHFRFCFIDIRFEMGYLSHNTTEYDVYQYTHQYLPEYNADMILIDGRFRVYCAFLILPQIKNNTFVYIHDFDRKEYHYVLNYYDKVKQHDRLVKLQKKKF